jgi:hypothetical protein
MRTQRHAAHREDGGSGAARSRRLAAAALLCGVVLVCTPSSGRAQGVTFEAVAADAQAGDLVGAVEDLIGTCDDQTDEREKRACEAMLEDLRARAKSKAWYVLVDPPLVARGKPPALRTITLTGCLICRDPPVLAGAPRLITASEPPPAKKASPPGSPSLSDGLGLVDLGRTVVEDPGPTERNGALLAITRARTEAVVRLRQPRAWHRGEQSGIVVEVIAYRVFDPCTGKVYLSSPPSGLLLPQTEDSVCKLKVPFTSRAQKAPTLPEQLSAEDLERTFVPVRQHARQCFQRFRVRGRVDLSLDVRPDGTVKLVRSSGPLVDTPSADCVRAAAIRLRFPPFRSHTSMHITFPVLLR